MRSVLIRIFLRRPQHLHSLLRQLLISRDLLRPISRVHDCTVNGAQVKFSVRKQSSPFQHADLHLGDGRVRRDVGWTGRDQQGFFDDLQQGRRRQRHGDLCTAATPGATRMHHAQRRIGRRKVNRCRQKTMMRSFCGCS